MQFRDLQKQYEVLKPEMDAAMIAVASGAHFISGEQVKTLEERLAAYVGRKHCITCGNGTDALELCMMAWGVGPGDAVFVPDFTFFASGEAVSTMGGTPVFYDVCADTFNADAKSLEAAIEAVIAEGKLTPKAVVDVDLFACPQTMRRSPPCAKSTACSSWRTRRRASAACCTASATALSATRHARPSSPRSPSVATATAVRCSPTPTKRRP